MTHWTEEMFVENAAHYAPELEAAADRGAEEAASLLDLLAEEHDRDPGTALDVACGVGRHAVPLAERGVDVTGFDISAAFVERARERAADAGVVADTRFLEGDYRDPPVSGPFDLAVCLFTAIGYYDADTDQQVFERVRETLADDGAFVVEVLNREGLLSRFESTHVYEFEDHFGTEQRDYDPDTAALNVTRELFERRDDGLDHLTTFEYSVRVYAPVELRAMLRDAGFSRIDTYGDYDGSPLEHDSGRVFAVARP